tara:strand:- start:13870 stop:14529 length:660 start_codon:yes stop_codon:yes gene_type:complete
MLYLWPVSAYALDVGHCDTPEGLSAALKAEGHKIVASMDAVGISLKEGGKVGFVAEMVTATPDLKHWYVIKGDRPLGTKSTRFCIATKGRNLQINDHRKDGPPTVTRYRFDREKALAECDEVAKQFIDGVEKGIRCNEFNEGLRIAERDLNERIALQGEAEGGVLMTIVADPGNGPAEGLLGNRDYRMLVTASAGATGIARSGARFEFSQWVLSVLNQK